MNSFLLIISTVWLAYSNGANDNAKGVASLIGSRTLSVRSALRFAALATFAGSICTTLFAASLVRAFGGQGILPDHMLDSSLFPLAVLLASSGTVMIATLLGMPVSTTHAMLGGLVGTGLAAVASEVNITLVGTSFAAPLLFSPAVAICLTAPLYIIFRHLRRTAGLTEESCVCIGAAEPVCTGAVIGSSRSAVIAAIPRYPPALQVKTGVLEQCTSEMNSATTSIEAKGVLNGVHLLSGAALSFARGVNDTAKVIGPLVLVGVLSPQPAAVLAGLAMAAGGLISARKVADTMSEKITRINQGQGTISNIVSSCLVITAGRFGLPVSTTHVSCGSLFGIGLATRQANSRMIGSILAAWATTLPVAMGLAMAVYWIGTRIGGG